MIPADDDERLFGTALLCATRWETVLMTLDALMSPCIHELQIAITKAIWQTLHTNDPSIYVTRSIARGRPWSGVGVKRSLADMEHKAQFQEMRVKALEAAARADALEAKRQKRY
eukprot:TRINITY_DN1037_c0_g5_i1.p5 TRINITY_DN1037_c0_g5~~TRINITY_DN1037_c0_g5_i1.p5  ORF type:complete len:114 (+),score=19.94 TRINITY_DN1037_c0_g5_i1:533-874(+)